jgi:hypothetical protein
MRYSNSAQLCFPPVAGQTLRVDLAGGYVCRCLAMARHMHTSVRLSRKRVLSLSQGALLAWYGGLV